MLESNASLVLMQEKPPKRGFWKASASSVQVGKEIITLGKNIWKQPLSKLADVYQHGLYGHFCCVILKYFAQKNSVLQRINLI